MEILSAIFPGHGSPASRATRAAAVAALVLLAAAAAAPYLAGMRHEFVYDDIGQIVENAFLRNPARVEDVVLLKTLGDKTIVNGRRPLVLLTYFADRALWGEHPAGYRLTNLLFHVGSVLMLYLLVRRLGARASFAFVAALLFALHPALIEAVHVPAFRPDVMYTFFVLVCLRVALGLTGSPAALTRAGEAGPTPAAAGSSGAAFAGRIAAILLVQFLALASKEAGAVAPAVLVGIWICFPATRPGRGTMAAVLGGSVALIGGFLWLGAGSGVQAVGGPATGLSLGFPANLLTFPWLWVRWLGVLLWPYPLIADRIVDPVTSAVGWRFATGAAVLAAAMLAAVLSIRRRPWLALGVGWMLAGFFPVSNIVPLFNPLAERYLYFTTAGFALVVAWALAGRGVGGGRGPALRKGALAAVCAAYLTLSFMRMPDWRNSFVLWTRTLADEPRSARAHTWLGLEQKGRGHFAEAMAHFDAAAQLNPQDVTALVNRAILLGQAGDLAGAERALRAAIERRPDKAAAHWNLAVALQLQGRIAEALAEIDETLRLEPMHAVALKAKAALLAGAGRKAEALQCIERVLALDPGEQEALAARREWGGGAP